MRKINCDHLTWLKPELERIGPEALEHGAGTHRQFGRLAFYLNHVPIRHTIERQIAESLRFAALNPTKVAEDRIEVVIVMTLAGGTGSGMFIDVAYLVQDILDRPTYRACRSKSVTLIAFLPGLFDAHRALSQRFRQNAFAALLELEYYGTPRTGDDLLLGDVRHGARQERHWTGFMADWGDGNRRFIRGPGWDTCFLIDNRNDLDPNAPLSDRDVFQMAADYLFLDFENHELAVAKRSSRSNIVQFKDKVKETWVRRPDSREAAGGIFEGNSVYATQNGCRFSSFGLAEIYFDLEKLYQVAAYRLAAILVRSRWLGNADQHPESRYTTWINEHLFQPRDILDEEIPPSFHPERLTRQLLTTASGCWLDDITRDIESLSKIEPKEGLDRMRRLLGAHVELLHKAAPGDIAAARQTIQDNLVRLSGDAKTLGSLRTRLRELAARHCALHGVSSTLRLLDDIVRALYEIRERSLALPAGPTDHDLLARLVEAQMVPWPVHDTAVATEFSRARDLIEKALRRRYDQAAGMAIDRMLLDVCRYLRAPAQPPYPEVTVHGTLHAYYRRAQSFLRMLAERLEKRFKLTYGYDHFKVARRHSLGPNWDEATFDKRIDEALVLHPEINKSDDANDKFSFDWSRFEALVLQNLRNLHGAGMEVVKDVDDLIRNCFENERDNTEGIIQVADWLADACKVVLHGGKDASGLPAGGFQLRDEADGNAVDLLVRQADWMEILDRMVKVSMPYLQTTDPTRISNDFSPAYSNLYSQKQGETNTRVSERNAARVFEKVREIVASRAQYSASLARAISLAHWRPRTQGSSSSAR